PQPLAGDAAHFCPAAGEQRGGGTTCICPSLFQKNVLTKALRCPSVVSDRRGPPCPDRRRPYGLPRSSTPGGGWRFPLATAQSHTQTLVQTTPHSEASEAPKVGSYTLAGTGAHRWRQCRCPSRAPYAVRWGAGAQLRRSSGCSGECAPGCAVTK